MDWAKHHRRNAASKTHMRLACFPEDARPDGTKDFNLVGCSNMPRRMGRALDSGVTRVGNLGRFNRNRYHTLTLSCRCPVRTNLKWGGVIPDTTVAGLFPRSLRDYLLGQGQFVCLQWRCVRGSVMCRGGGERKAARGIGTWLDSTSPWRMAFASCGFVLLPPAPSSFGEEGEARRVLTKWCAGI